MGVIFSRMMRAKVCPSVRLSIWFILYPNSKSWFWPRICIDSDESDGF